MKKLERKFERKGVVTHFGVRRRIALYVYDRLQAQEPATSSFFATAPAAA